MNRQTHPAENDPPKRWAITAPAGEPHPESLPAPDFRGQGFLFCPRCGTPSPGDDVCSRCGARRCPTCGEV